MASVEFCGNEEQSTEGSGWSAGETRKGNSFLKAWAWKREHRPDRDRFEKPYHHSITSKGIKEILILKQKPFTSEGFASTVWDSAIVLSKYLEKWPSLVSGKRCLELGAGCGLAGIVCAKLGAKDVVLTDLPENLPLLKENAAINKLSGVTSVKSLIWGTSELQRGQQNVPPYDIVIATDVMYIIEAIDPLIASMLHLSGNTTKILLAYGRNRRAESLFMSKASEHYVVEKVPDSSLDDLYQTLDVDVYLLQLTKSRPTHNRDSARQAR